MPDLAAIASEYFELIFPNRPQVPETHGYAILALLALPEHRAALVAWLVEAKVAEQAIDATVGAPYWFAHGEAVMADEYDDNRPVDAVPLWRIGGNRG